MALTTSSGIDGEKGTEPRNDNERLHGADVCEQNSIFKRIRGENPFRVHVSSELKIPLALSPTFHRQWLQQHTYHPEIHPKQR